MPAQVERRHRGKAWCKCTVVEGGKGVAQVAGVVKAQKGARWGGRAGVEVGGAAPGMKQQCVVVVVVRTCRWKWCYARYRASGAQCGEGGVAMHKRRKVGRM